MEGSSILSHLEASVSSMSISRLLAARPATSASGAVERKDYPTIALAVILTVQSMLVLDVTVVNIALPQMQETLHFSQQSLVDSQRLSADLWSACAAAARWPHGRPLWPQAPLHRRRRAMAISLSGDRTWPRCLRWRLHVSRTGRGTADPRALVAARALQGIGAALAAPSALALLMTSFPEGPQRNRALGVFHRRVSAGGSTV